MRILIVEDDPVSLKYIASILEKKHFEVLLMNSAVMAINYLQNKNSADIIISDIMMPEVSGYDFLKFLKSSNRLKNIPVILCSCLDDRKSMLTGISLGAADYVTKPINADVLFSKVDKILKGIPGAVLVVDDEKLLCKHLVMILELSGYRSIAAFSGTEALQLMERDKVSVVLSDVRMPEMSGYELLIDIKNKYPGVPMLLMSGYVEKVDHLDDIGVKADGFIAKPFHNTEIISRIRKLCK